MSQHAPGAGALTKYHAMNILENSVNTEGKKALSIMLVAVLSGGYFVTDAIDNWHGHFDDQGIETEQQSVYKTLSQQIADFQNAAEQLPVIRQKIEGYEDLDKKERTPEIISKQMDLQAQLTDTQSTLDTMVKEISVTALNNGNMQDGLAISETDFDELWQQLKMTEPDLRELYNDFDIKKFPAPSVAYLDECRVATKMNPDAPLNVQYNAAATIASCATDKAVGNGFLAVAKTAGITLIFGLAIAGIDGRRRRKYGWNNMRPKPKGPASH